LQIWIAMSFPVCFEKIAKPISNWNQT
jgi:hypothetical protein